MKSARFLTFGGLAVFGLALGAIAGVDSLLGSKAYQELLGTQRSRVEVIEACNVHVRAAELEARAAIDQRAAEFATFVEERKAGVAPFAKDLVSLHGKWRVIKAKLPFTDKEGHTKYVEAKFGEHIFSSAELASQMELIVSETAMDLEAIENRLAVKLRAEIVGEPIGSIDTAASMSEFSAAIERVKSASDWDVKKAGASLAVSEVTAVVGTQVLVRLGVSAGLLTAGAANSWWTLGAGIVLGLIADLLWDLIDDPARDIEVETVAALDRLATNGSDILRAELGTVVTERATLWTTAVEEMVP